jgi:hypothetical protein
MPLSRMESAMAELIPLPSGYQEFLQELKGRIHTAQVRAAFAVNREVDWPGYPRPAGNRGLG